jgi:hypothetical protein
MTDLLIGFLIGLAVGSVVLRWGMRKFLKNRLALRKLISEMYHKDLLPEICRMEGLNDLALRSKDEQEQKKMIELALKEIKVHKDKIIHIIQKYEKYQ